MLFKKVWFLGLVSIVESVYPVFLEVKLAEAARQPYYIQVYGQKMVTKKYYTDLTEYIEGYCLDHEASILRLEVGEQDRIQVSNKQSGGCYASWQKFELFGSSKVLVGTLVEHKRAHFGDVVVSVVED